MGNPAAFRKKGILVVGTSCPRSTKYQNPVEKNHTLDMCIQLLPSLYPFLAGASLRPLSLPPPEGFEWEVAVKPLSQPAVAVPAMFPHFQMWHFRLFSVRSLHHCPRLRNTAHFDCLPSRKAPAQQLHMPHSHVGVLTSSL